MSHDPWADMAARLPGWRLVREPLPDGRLGDCDHTKRVIRVASGIAHRQARSTLAHEIEHALSGDTGGARDEARAELAAARRLIPLAALIDAARWTLDPAEAAELLDVDPPLLAARIERLHPSERASLARALGAAERAA